MAGPIVALAIICWAKEFLKPMLVRRRLLVQQRTSGFMVMLKFKAVPLDA
jgi:hypothetical protein